MSDVLIEAQGIGKRYRRSTLGGIRLPRLGRRLAGEPPDGFWALKDIDLELKAGDSLGIIGPNGAGKSTLLKILSRVTKPTEGWLKVRGRVGALIEVGAGFHPELSGRDNIFINGAILGMSRREVQRRFDEIVAFAELEDFIDTPVKKYSSGMYVRLGFAVAAHMDPDVLLVDEVLAVGDGRFQKKCIDSMVQYQRRGALIVLVSHYLANIVNNCNRAMLLRDGTIAGVGDADRICTDYMQEMMGGQGEGPRQYVPGASFGTMDVEIESAESVDAKGMPTAQFHTGDTCGISFRYTNRSGVESGCGAVTIHDMSGGEVLRVQSDWDGDVVALASGSGEFHLRIPCLALTPGDYMVTVAVKDATGNSSFHVLWQHWRVTVISTRFAIGTACLPHEWKHSDVGGRMRVAAAQGDADTL